MQETPKTLTRDEIIIFLSSIGEKSYKVQDDYGIPNNALTRYVGTNTKKENRILTSEECEKIEKALFALGYNSKFRSEEVAGKVMAFNITKGGVGKTTVAVNVACCMASRGYKVLVIDADPQGNATNFFGLAGSDNGTDTALLNFDEAQIRETEINTNIHVLPSNEQLEFAYEELIQKGLTDTFNFDKVADLARRMYDYVIIDTPPRGGSLPSAIFNSTDLVFMPTSLSSFAIDGLTKAIMKTVQNAQKKGIDFKVGGVIINQFDSTYKIQNKYLRGLKDNFGDIIMDSILSKSREFQNTIEVRKDVTLRRSDASSAKSANEMNSLVSEIISKFK
jgi:chromosome partitioning protein